MTPCYYCEHGIGIEPPKVKTKECNVCIHHPQGPSVEAMEQVFTWADSWVENESGLPECPDSRRTQGERVGMQAIKLWEAGQP
jgi:hypothetical protein